MDTAPRRTIARIAVAVIFAVALTACGQGDETTAADGSTEPPTPTSAASSATPGPDPSASATEPADSTAPTEPTETSSAAPDNTAQVTIADFAFGPSRTEVDAGQQVEWTNTDSAGHTVKLDGVESSGVVKTDEGFAHTFTEPGAIDYRCELHSDMTGTVVVTG